MKQRNFVIIDEKKSKSFADWIKATAPDKQYWERVRQAAHTSFDKKVIDELYNKQEH